MKLPEDTQDELVDRAYRRWYARGIRLTGQYPQFPSKDSRVEGRYVVLWNVNGELARYRIKGTAKRPTLWFVEDEY